jgi:DNA polymerase-3 subunit delta
MQEYMAAARTYGAEGIESALLLLHEYNLKSLGVHALATADDSLMKEMVVKMMW